MTQVVILNRRPVAGVSSRGSLDREVGGLPRHRTRRSATDLTQMSRGRANPELAHQWRLKISSRKLLKLSDQVSNTSFALTQLHPLHRLHYIQIRVSLSSISFSFSSRVPPLPSSRITICSQSTATTPATTAPSIPPATFTLPAAPVAEAAADEALLAALAKALLTLLAALAIALLTLLAALLAAEAAEEAALEIELSAELAADAALPVAEEAADEAAEDPVEVALDAEPPAGVGDWPGAQVADCGRLVTPAWPWQKESANWIVAVAVVSIPLPVLSSASTPFVTARVSWCGYVPA